MLALAALAFLGCAPPKDYVFIFEGPPEDLPVAQFAAAEWSKCGVVHVEVRTEGEGDARIVPVDGWGPDKHPETRGYTSDHRSVIEYQRLVSTRTEWMLNVLTHEMGHAIGLEHSDREDSVMWPINRYEYITPVRQADCDDLAARGWLDTL